MNKNFSIQYLLSLIIYIVIILSVFYCGYIKNVNNNKSLVNSLLIYYPDYNISIIDSDQNSILIEIKK